MLYRLAQFCHLPFQILHRSCTASGARLLGRLGLVLQFFFGQMSILVSGPQLGACQPGVLGHLSWLVPVLPVVVSLHPLPYGPQALLVQNSADGAFLFGALGTVAVLQGISLYSKGSCCLWQSYLPCTATQRV